MLKHVVAAALLLAMGSMPVMATETKAVADPAAAAAKQDTETAKGTTNTGDQPTATDCTAGWKSTMKWTEQDFIKFCAK